MLRGLDVSQFQLRIDWAGVAKSGYRFVYVRASFGGHNDQMCAKHVRGARSAGLEVGLYHYFSPGTDHGLQSQLFLGALSTLKDSVTLIPALDVESKDGKGNAFVVSSVRTMCDDMKSLYPRVMLYTFPYFITDPATGMPVWPADFADKPLWISHYGVSKPIIPKPWTWYTCWQDQGNSGRVSGVFGPCDTDQVASEDVLAALRLPACSSIQPQADIAGSMSADITTASPLPK